MSASTKPEVLGTDDQVNVDIEVIDGARVLTIAVPSRGVRFVLDQGDAAEVGRALILVATKAAELDQADAAQSGSSIILPASRH